jgi:hypothetical protein
VAGMARIMLVERVDEGVGRLGLRESEMAGEVPRSLAIRQVTSVDDSTQNAAVSWTVCKGRAGRL